MTFDEWVLKSPFARDYRFHFMLRTAYDAGLASQTNSDRTENAVSDLEKQEKLTSALWGFAYDLQHNPLDLVCEGDGTKMNLDALQRAKEIIAAIFGLRLHQIQ
ncbi:MAG: hypothetical protein FJ045_01775 [Crenarchaeota archaeon]|nr:hypothetical protein [Thermoproteota archaeon]